MSASASQFSVPDELEFIEFFGGEPTERAVDDGFWRYETTDERGVHLRFSFDLYERSVQTELHVGNQCVSCVSSEGATKAVVDGGALNCTFAHQGSKTKLTISLDPAISVSWSTLRTA